MLLQLDDDDYDDAEEEEKFNYFGMTPGNDPAESAAKIPNRGGKTMIQTSQ